MSVAALSTQPPTSDTTLPELSSVGVVPTAAGAATASPSSSASSPHARPLRTSCFQWVPSDAIQTAETEQRLLHGLVFEQRRLHGINTISSLGYNDAHNGKQHTVVLIHGFAGGLGCWAQNWSFLSARFNVHAIDLPGFARSDRTKRSFRNTEDAMAYFCTSLRFWLRDAGIPADQPVTMVGHSFGGYVATQYVLRALREAAEPDATAGGAPPVVPVVRHVVLADPWGVPPASQRKLALKFRVALRLFYAFSPLGIVRLAGPWGPNLLPKVRPDFADRWNSHLPDPMVFYDYSYHCNAQVPATGEHAFKACCEGPAFAKEPLLHLVPTALRAASHQGPTSAASSANLAVTFLYGECTWMDTAAGMGLARILASEGLVARVSCATIAGAGHQLNTDNADDFNSKLEAAILGHLQRYE